MAAVRIRAFGEIPGRIMGAITVVLVMGVMLAAAMSGVGMEAVGIDRSQFADT